MSDLFPLFAPQFVAAKSEEEIALRLREDEALIDAGKSCSWVAWHLDDNDEQKSNAIAEHLAPKIPLLSRDIKSLIYENLVNKIRRHLRSKCRDDQQKERAKEQFDPSEVTIALKVLSRLVETSVIQQNTSAEMIISYLKQQFSAPQPLFNAPTKSADPAMSSVIPQPPPVPQKRRCYICRLVISYSYPSHPALCTPCGTFNHSSSLLSMLPTLSFPAAFTALVTGARINLGYHTALRLLRCGARVIATTRYPRDAVDRYLGEADSSQWKDRLRVIGADFRCAADAFALVGETKQCLKEWATDEDMRLHLLINNAAQTLTDSVKKEKQAAQREMILGENSEGTAILIGGAYKARVRGRATILGLKDSKPSREQWEELQESIDGDAQAVQAVQGPNNFELKRHTGSSWVQSLFDIPYEDVISAHAVNTFVPLILCRELLPLMGTPVQSPSNNPASPSTKPHAYIINVSSREGIFEDRINSASKGGKHVHTNMSKAALNMITETEAATAWASRRVAMNTVDPGYMSAAPELEDAFGGVRPIGWEDGAGRVLWPVAVGEIEGHVIWGRFLKHYGAVEVDPGAGR